MKDKNVLILDHIDIEQKVKRIAYEIWENNYDEKEICFIGIKDNGYVFAERIYDYLNTITDIKLSLFFIALDKAHPHKGEMKYNFDPKDLNNKVIIIADDVGNTGRTLCYALKPFLSHRPKKIEIAVLVDRKHKSFPVCADYVGLSLSTTMKEHVTIDLEKEKEAAWLS